MKALTFLLTVIVIAASSTLTSSGLCQVSNGEGFRISEDGGSHGGGVIENEDSVLMRIQKDMSKIKALADCKDDDCGVRDDECLGCANLTMGSLLKRIESRLESVKNMQASHPMGGSYGIAPRNTSSARESSLAILLQAISRDMKKMEQLKMCETAGCLVVDADEVCQSDDCHITKEPFSSA